MAENNSDLDKWFKNSVIVGSDGRPKAVYHGSHEKFDQFEMEDTEHWVGPGMYDCVKTGLAFFSSDIKTASTYGEYVMDAYLKIENPLVLDAEGKSFEEFVPFHHVGTALARGHDGLIVNNIRDDAFMKGDPATTYVVFNEDQIMSVRQYEHEYEVSGEEMCF